MFLFLCLHATGLKWQPQYYQQVKYRRRLLVLSHVKEISLFFTFIYIQLLLSCLLSSHENIVGTLFKYYMDSTPVMCSQLFTYHKGMHV